jgi:hypothetical protein
MSSTESEFSLRRWLSRRRRLLMFLAIIAAVILLGVLQAAPRGFVPDASDLLVFPDLAAIELSVINLYDPTTGLAITLSRGDDGRWIEEGSNTEFDPAYVNQLAQTIVMLAYDHVLPLGPDDDLAVYGFAPAGQLFVEFIEADGTQHAVAFGNLLPDRDAGYYALVDDRPQLYVIPRGAADYLLSQLPGEAVTATDLAVTDEPTAFP